MAESLFSALLWVGPSPLFWDSGFWKRRAGSRARVTARSVRSVSTTSRRVPGERICPSVWSGERGSPPAAPPPPHWPAKTTPSVKVTLLHFLFPFGPDNASEEHGESHLRLFFNACCNTRQ
ncbi:hypothetical protein AAFF_G00255510 [Aldrovandia affinis]|uniref:Uncharacterized protein n=1 Tax=Aldrovandia affinis TaxID=143900 RepID=A0AAD7RCJ7_9TELE|nr:hypothetical protein AAFF_G00255510 [Aldrovandia affinis]